MARLPLLNEAQDAHSSFRVTEIFINAQKRKDDRIVIQTACIENSVASLELLQKAFDDADLTEKVMQQYVFVKWLRSCLPNLSSLMYGKILRYSGMSLVTDATRDRQSDFFNSDMIFQLAQNTGFKYEEDKEKVSVLVDLIVKKVEKTLTTNSMFAGNVMYVLEDAAFRHICKTWKNPLLLATNVYNTYMAFLETRRNALSGLEE